MQKRVALVTNTEEQCGNAQYGRDLIKYLQHFKDISAIDTFAHCREMGPAFGKHRYDVAVINWHPARVEINTSLVHGMQGSGIKVLLILQNSFDWEHRVGTDDLLAVCDAVVAHEPMKIFYNGTPAHNFHYIPHGIVPDGPTLEGVLPEDSTFVGTGGWPFPWKRPDVVVKAAAKCGMGARIFCPPYPGFEWPIASWFPLWYATARAVVGLDAGHTSAAPCLVAPVQGWHSEEEVISILGRSMFNIFWFESKGIEDQFGQSGSVRLGVAARRPMIISRHRKFRTLIEEYPDEFYVADTEDEVYTLAKQLSEDITAGKKVKTPMRCVISQNWWRAAEKYAGVIDKICN